MQQNINLKSACAGLAATFVGNGIGRFAFIVLFPVIIQQAWFSYAEVSYLGAATLLGYLIGIPFNQYLNKRMSTEALLRLAMLTCSLSYLACSWPSGGFYWFLLWRMISGITGAMLMVLAPSLVLRKCPAKKRGRCSSIVFSGIGIGVMVSGTLIPLLILRGLKETFLVLGFICLLLTFYTWNQWSPSSESSMPHTERYTKDERIAISLLLLAYGLNAIGYLPHTLFWVDYITHELKMSIFLGGFFWAIFGIGAIIGPIMTGECGRHFGLPKTLLMSFLLKAVGVALPLLSEHPISIFFSSLVVGIFTPGVVNIVSSYTLVLAGVNRHQQAWGWMTFSFAFAQAMVSFMMIYIMTEQSSYKILFALSACALLLACACIVILIQKKKKLEMKI